MNRRHLLQSIVSVTAAVALLVRRDDAANAQSKAAKDTVYDPCAAACRACEKACIACNKHCDGMVKAGMTEHETSRRLSADCRDLCAVSAKIVARRGPLSVATCTACAEACDRCGAECGKHPDMAEMKQCAESCARCSKACRAMITKLKGKQSA